ncbi:MAG: hypothetical protein HUU02_10255 [Bacteroidetes bacterium]|nr:hypothetical protein [Bacteroidota bacterium]
MRLSAIILAAILLSVPLSAQDGDQVFISSSTERDTIYAVIPQPMLSFGVTGGLAFVNPEELNDMIERNNSIYGAGEYSIKRPAQWSIWMTYRPKNLPTFLTLRAELLSNERSFPFTTKVTGGSSAVITEVASTVRQRYTVLPFTVGSGTVFNKTIARGEIGFIYALAWISQTTDVPGYSNSETVYEGSGYGFRVNLQQVVPIERTFSLTMDLGYRFLIVDDFRDEKGLTSLNTKINYSGIIVGMGVSYGF